jgi:alcohol dehydrogenase (cytochrome c)/quinohemoprotein ethanol dehydrogenase
MSFSPKTKLVYLPAQEMTFPYTPDNNFSPKQLAVNLGVDMLPASFPDDPAVINSIKEATRGHLSAWDPIQQKEVWRVQYPGMWNGGVLSTAGDLVFQGSATGYLNAYHAETGAKLWEHSTQTGVVAPPITYRVNGEQYITVSAGWGGIFPLLTGPLSRDSDPNPVNRSRLLTFKIGGQAKLPELNEVAQSLPNLSNIELESTSIERVHGIYERYCTACHGTGAVGGGIIPDLRYSSSLTNQAAWKAIVHEGVLSSRGMVGFSKELSEENVEDLRAFVIGRNQFANELESVTK